MRGLPGVLRGLWTWSWVPGLCFLALVAPWLHRTLDHFTTFGVYRDIDPFSVTLGESGNRELDHLARRAGLWLAGASPHPADPALRLRDIHLYVTGEALARLDGDLPYSGRKYVPARMRAGGRERRVDVRYRGDTYAHWGYAKKSFRVRTREDPFEGMRRFNLIAPKYPEQLNNLLSYRLASRLGLLAPRVELVTVFLNDRYHGLYVLTEQLDSGTLRANDRMPGDIYAGELLMRDAWTGVPNQLFTRATLWHKMASDDRRPADCVAPLAELIGVINRPADEGSLSRLAELIDIDKFARLSVLEQLTQSHHNDHFHNWRLYWDPWRRRFEPIVWDLVGWIDAVRPRQGEAFTVHPVFSPLHALLHVHAGFHDARHRVLRDFYGTGQDRAFLEDVQQAMAAAAAPLTADPNLRPPDHEAVARAMSRLRDFVERALRGVRAAMLEGPGDLRWRPADGAGEAVLLQVETDRPVRGLELVFSAPVQPTAASLRVPRSEGATLYDLRGRWRVRGPVVTVEVPLVSELETVLAWRPGTSTVRNNLRVAVPTSYELTLGGVDMRELIEVRAGRGDSRRFARTPDLVARPVRALRCLVPPPG